MGVGSLEARIPRKVFTTLVVVLLSCGHYHVGMLEGLQLDTRVNNDRNVVIRGTWEISRHGYRGQADGPVGAAIT